MGTKRKIAILPWSSVPNHELTDQMQALIHEEPSPSSASSSPSNIDHPDPLPPAFPVQPSLNGKVALWHGNALDLPVDGLVHPTNELFERLSPLTDQLYQRSSAELRRELFTKLVKCPTGSVKVTRSYAHRTQVGAKLIIHVASPKYLAKYGCASERWLFKCYFNTLLAAKKCSLRTLALPSLALHVNGFPPHRATQLAVRVVRRFLEKHGECFDLIVFTVDSLDQYHLYESALKLFFPRSEEEVERQRLAKLDNADQDGQPCVPGREIRIKKNPIKVLTGKNGKPRGPRGLSASASMDKELREDQENLGPVQMRSGSFNNSGGDNSGDDGEVIILKPRPQHPSLAPRLLNRCHSFGQMHETRDRKRIIHRTKGQGGQTQTRPLQGKVSSCAGPLEQQLHLSVGPSTLPFSSSSPSLSSTSEQSQYPNGPKSKEHQLLAEIQRKLRLERLQRQVKLAQRKAQDPQEAALIKQKLNKTIFISHLASASSGGSKAELDSQSCSSNGSQSSSGSRTFKSSSPSSSPSPSNSLSNKSILTIMGSHFEPEVVCTAQGMEHVMKLLDRIALTARPFDIVYFHHGWSSGTGNSSGSAMSTDTFLATLLGEYVGWQHSTLLDRIYVVNCSIMERLRFWWKRATVLKCLSHKLSFVNSIDQLLALVPEGGSLMHNHDLLDNPNQTTTTAALESTP